MVVSTETDHNFLIGLRKPNGFFSAANSPDYQNAWVRDNVYAAMGLEACGDKTFANTYHAIFDALKKHKSRLVYAAEHGDGNAPFRARFNADTMDELNEQWGDKQNDAVGLFLYKVGDLYKKGVRVIRDHDDLEIVKYLVKYLERSDYHSSSDHGIWEWGYEKHASSIGACVAGLESIRSAVEVKQELIDNGKRALDEMLPRESPSRDVDLALLSLVWPFDVAGDHSKRIVDDVENKLTKAYGTIRYGLDHYWNMHGNGEPQWPLGMPWLAMAHKKLGNETKSRDFLEKADSLRLPDSSFPESYHRDFGEINPNPNSPLGWAHALYIIAAN